MIQLTLKTIADFEGQGPYLNVELTDDGTRIQTTGIKLPNNEYISELGQIDLALRRLTAEESIPF